MAYSDVALLLALTLTVALAYPAKDDEAYYNRLHDFQDSYGKEVRNLDGIDARDEERPLFSFLSKTEQAKDSEEGSDLNFGFGSSSHLDGIGGGHLVRDLELEQGLMLSVLDVSLPEFAYAGKPRMFGVVRRFPVTSKLGNPAFSEGAMKNLIKTTELPKLSASCFKNELSYNGYPMRVFSKNELPNFNYDTNQNRYIPRYMVASGEGNFLNAKRSLDSIGGGHLLNTKKELDNFGGGNILNYKKDLDSIGGGHLLNHKKDLDSIGGGHLLSYKKDLDSIGGGHLLKYKKDLDSIGGGHLLMYKKDFDTPDDDSLLNTNRYMDSLGGDHLLNFKKDIDYLLEGMTKRKNPPYTTYQKYYSGAGLPIKSSRPLCTNSRWFQNILNNYLAKEDLKSNSMKVLKANKGNVLNNGLKDKPLKYKVYSPRWLNVGNEPDVINAGLKGLSVGVHQTASDGGAEAPFSGIIELNKVYMP